jgi:hypothetical protein
LRGEATLTWISCRAAATAYDGTSAIREVHMRILLASLSLPLLLAASAAAPAQQHADHAALAAASAPAPATRWQTDAPLREGMARISAAVAALGHNEHGHMDAAQVKQLVAGIQRDIGAIVSKCKLDPRADAALHPILGTLAQGAQSLDANPRDREAIPRMRVALQDYARQFDDPGTSSTPPAKLP